MHQVEGQSARNEAAVFVAVELSKSTWLLAAQGSPSGRTSSHRLDADDVDGLLAVVRRLQAREQQACGNSEVQVILGHEAGYDGFWLQRRLATDGIRCCVMNPSSLAARPARRGGPRPTGWTRRCFCGH